MAAIYKRIDDISHFMQQFEGEFADYYNLRKHRSGAFWGERYHCALIENGDHLWNCLRYGDYYPHTNVDREHCSRKRSVH